MIKLQEKQEEEKEWEREKQVLGAYCIHSKPGSYPLPHYFIDFLTLLNYSPNLKERKAPQMALPSFLLFPTSQKKE